MSITKIAIGISLCHIIILFTYFGVANEFLPIEFNTIWFFVVLFVVGFWYYKIQISESSVGKNFRLTKILVVTIIINVTPWLFSFLLLFSYCMAIPFVTGGICTT